jgi:drug/metabolite transporter (DMT)-like permease
MTRRGWLLFLAISLFWGIPYFFIKIAVRQLDPSVVVVARLGIAAAVLLPLAIHSGALRHLRGRWLTIIMLALVQIAGPFLLISYGEQHIASSLASLLIAAEPLLVALFALRLDRSERVSGPRLIGLVVGMGGVVTLLGLDLGGDRQEALGAAMLLVAAAGYAVGALLIKRPIITALPRLGVVAAECAAAALVVLPLAVMRLPQRLPSLSTIASLLVLGLLCTALAYLVYFALVAEVGASRGTVFTYVNPAVAVALGVIVLGEPLNAAIVMGFFLIIVGSWLSTGGALRPLLGRPSPAQMKRQVPQEGEICGQDAS